MVALPADPAAPAAVPGGPFVKGDITDFYFLDPKLNPGYVDPAGKRCEIVAAAWISPTEPRGTFVVHGRPVARIDLEWLSAEQLVALREVCPEYAAVLGRWSVELTAKQDDFGLRIVILHGWRR
jgi:hypothetical protein